MKTQPISSVAWVKRNLLKPNGYNPNHVAKPELDLLALSILEDGWTAPIVALRDFQIVDGYHRWLVSERAGISKMTDGKVPVVFINADKNHRMMSTIRHNRARGQHAVLAMADIVREMYESGLKSDEIQRRLGMEDEELERLLDRSGMTVRGSAGACGFNRAWVPARR